MIDAYSHLDMEHPEPLADVQQRMESAGVASALLVETWNGANRALLEEVLRRESAGPFRIALCYRDASAASLHRFLGSRSLAGVRMSTNDIAAADGMLEKLAHSGALLIAHAESGVGALCRAIARMRDRFPATRVYVPHLGWPAGAGGYDADWQPAIQELAAMPSLTVGVSAIAHFSRLPFPHEDVREWALFAASQMPAGRVAIGSDYPLFEKGRYADYLSLARKWVTSIHEGWSFAL